MRGPSRLHATRRSLSSEVCNLPPTRSPGKVSQLGKAGWALLGLRQGRLLGRRTLFRVSAVSEGIASGLGGLSVGPRGFGALLLARNELLGTRLARVGLVVSG